jgi:serine/threonine protein phosphatase PrpC
VLVVGARGVGTISALVGKSEAERERERAEAGSDEASDAGDEEDDGVVLSDFRTAVMDAGNFGLSDSYSFLTAEGESVDRERETDIPLAECVVVAANGDSIVRLEEPEGAVPVRKPAAPTFASVTKAELLGIGLEAASAELWSTGKALTPAATASMSTAVRAAIADAAALKEAAGADGDRFDAKKFQAYIVKSIAEAKAAFAASDEAYPERTYHSCVHDEMGMASSMEDKTQLVEDLNELAGITDAPPTYYYAVFDGHGGSEAAEYARTHLHLNIAAAAGYKKKLKSAIVEGYRRTHEDFCKLAGEAKVESGTAVTTLLLRDGKAYVHWLGHVTALVNYRSRAVAVSTPHFMGDDSERERVVKAGAKVEWKEAGWRVEDRRVGGSFGVARSLGDAYAKGALFTEPEGKVRHLTDDDKFFMLASDGLLDVIKPTDAVNITTAWVNAPDRNPDDVCRALVGEAIRRRSHDNITCLIVFVPGAGLPVLHVKRNTPPLVPLELPTKPLSALVTKHKQVYEEWKKAQGSKKKSKK